MTRFCRHSRSDGRALAAYPVRWPGFWQHTRSDDRIFGSTRDQIAGLPASAQAESQSDRIHSPLVHRTRSDGRVSDGAPGQIAGLPASVQAESRSDRVFGITVHEIRSNGQISDSAPEQNARKSALTQTLRSTRRVPRRNLNRHAANSRTLATLLIALGPKRPRLQINIDTPPYKMQRKQKKPGAAPRHRTHFSIPLDTRLLEIPSSAFP